MRIRVGAAEDLAAVVGLERGAAEAPHWAAGHYEAALAGEGAVARRVFVAEVDGRVVGFAVGAVGELENVVVGREARRAGVGRALCEAVVGWCGAMGAGEVMLEVRVSSGGAIALYEGLGFVEVGRRKGYYAGPVEDALVMRLGPGSG